MRNAAWTRASIMIIYIYNIYIILYIYIIYICIHTVSIQGCVRIRKAQDSPRVTRVHTYKVPAMRVQHVYKYYLIQTTKTSLFPRNNHKNKNKCCSNCTNDSGNNSSCNSDSSLAVITAQLVFVLPFLKRFSYMLNRDSTVIIVAVTVSSYVQWTRYNILILIPYSFSPPFNKIYNSLFASSL